MKHLAGDDTARSGRKQTMRRYQRRPATIFASVLDSLRVSTRKGVRAEIIRTAQNISALTLKYLHKTEKNFNNLNGDRV